MKLKKIFATLILFFILFNTIVPVINYSVGNTRQENDEEIEQEIGKEYEIKEEETWDISKDGDGSVIAKWTLNDRTLTISGNGEMKDWDVSSKEDWHNKGYYESIENIIIKDGIKNIGNRFFYYEGSNESIITLALSEDYSHKSALTHIEIPNSVTSIGKMAFFGCESLKTINIPNGVTSINNMTFYKCSSLTNIEIPNSVTGIDYSAFMYCSSLTEINVDSNNQNYLSVDGILFNKNKTKIIKCPAKKEMINFKVPNSVTSIESYAFNDCSSLTSIEIPHSVISIGRSAFSGCSSLASINIPYSVNNIEYGTFYECNSLTNVVIPNSIKTIGQRAFAECSGLKNIEIPNSVTSIERDAFDGCISLTNIEIPNSITSISLGAFYKCSSLTSINIPNSVTEIGEYAFQYCSSLTSINIPDSVTNIEGYAFYGCSSLTEINIPNSVTCIGQDAFYNCSNLANITIPNSVTDIGEYAFENCKGVILCKTNSEAHRYAESEKIGYILTDDIESQYGKDYEIKAEKTWDVSKNNDSSVIAKWTLENRTLTISGGGDIEDGTSLTDGDWHNTIYTNAIEKVIIDKGITGIGKNTFSSCGCLKEINVNSENENYTSENGILFNKNKTELILYIRQKEGSEYSIPNSVTSIGDYAFYKCSNLTNITIPNSVTSIGNYAFSECSNLTNITISNNITNIGRGTFSECRSLVSIEIPNSVTCIGEDAFYGCSSLKNIEISNSVTTIEKAAFYNCKSITNIKIPNGVTTIDNLSFMSCSNLKNIEIPNSVTEIGYCAFWYCSSLANIEIPNNVTSIGRNAFCQCNNLTKVTIPNGVTSIGSYAFGGCNSLNNIEISSSVKSIENNAFSGCSNLKEISVDSNNSRYLSIDGILFNKDKTELILYPSQKEGSEYSIPNSVTRIGEYAFYKSNNLSDIEIPNSVTDIGRMAFFGSGLTNIIIPKKVMNLTGSGIFNKCKGPIICKNNSGLHRYLENNEVVYIADNEAPEIKYIPNTIVTPQRQASIEVELGDNISGVEESSLKYVWSTKEEITKEEITNSFINGEKIISPKGVEGTYYLYIYAEDKVGNEAIARSNVIELSNIPPQLEVSYSEKRTTNQDVVVTIAKKQNEEYKDIKVEISTDNVNYIEQEGVFRKTFTQNGTIYVRVIQDNEIGEALEIRVDNIDKDAPKVTGVIDGGIYANSATPVVEDKNLESVRLLKKEKIQDEQIGEEEIKENEVENYNNGDKITDLGDYKIIATDKAGNTTIVEFVIEYVMLNGDLNENSKIDIGDILMLNRHMAQANNSNIYENHPDWRLSEQKILSGDLNGNKIIDIGDVLKLRRYMAAQNSNQVATKHPDWLNL